ncbi:MAG: hypothetical protein HZY76_21790 [Anaerolineae bacterium]|nr:MAG: hypothetical protein HZY76_21790 [Anaerolineae bacterium]
MAPSIYFPEYCLHPPRPATSPGPEIHIVYCGGVWPEDRYPAATHGYAQYLEVARRLAAQQLHLHIYPANRGDGVPFAEFSPPTGPKRRPTPIFISTALPYAGLMAALPTYDFAMHIFGPGIDTQTGQNSPDKLRYSSANKLFDYIEAGLPVIMHSGFHQRGLVRHYGRAIVIDTLDGLAERLHVAGRAPFPRRVGDTGVPGAAPGPFLPGVVMRVIILGARADGHARVVLDILEASGVTVVGFLDDDPTKWGQAIRGRPILGGVDRLAALITTHQPRGHRGDWPRAAARWGSTFARRACGWSTPFIPRRTWPATRSSAQGVPLPRRDRHARRTPGDCVTLYTAATVDHDSVLEDGANLSPGVHTAGRVHLGRDVFVGVGAVFIPDVRVGEGAYIGAGAVVIRDVAPYDVVAGVPARSIKKREGEV